MLRNIVLTGEKNTVSSANLTVEDLVNIAKRNTGRDTPIFSELELIKFHDISELSSLKSLMSPDYKAIMDDEAERQEVADDIDSGISFALFYDENGISFSR